VFVTAHDEHAIQAFERKAVDYVLKGLDWHRSRRYQTASQGIWWGTATARWKPWNARRGRNSDWVSSGAIVVDDHARLSERGSCEGADPSAKSRHVIRPCSPCRTCA
jgi:hypothetical protein